MPVTPERFVELMRLAARQAGAVARHLQSQVRLERKGGHSPESEALTAVDLGAQEVILQLLAHALPDIAVDAEEETESVALFAPEDGRDLVVIDPIDGTLNYARGSKDFAVMAALIQDGLFTAAVLHFPVLGRTCHAIRGQGAFLDGERVRRLEAPPRALVHPRPDPALIAQLAAAGLEAVPSRCSAVESTAPVLGRAAAALSPWCPDRRRAIGFLVTTEAGGVVHIGPNRWRGEDVVHLTPDAGPTIVARDEALAEALLAVV